MLDKLRRIAFWSLPFILLAIIFHEVDVSRLVDILQVVDPRIFLLAVVLQLATTFVGASRWRVLLSYFNDPVPSMVFCVKHYWIGLATGYLTPGAIGMDIYRVVVIGRLYRNYVMNIAAILVEKFIALAVCMLIIIVIYAAVVPIAPANKVSDLLTAAYVLLVTAVLVIAFMALLNRNIWLNRFAKKLEKFAFSRIEAIAARLRLIDSKESMRMSLMEVLPSILQPMRLLKLSLFSLVIQIVSALVLQLLFQSMAYDIPYLVNLFLGPVFFLIFLMPLSFAGIGIREGSFILLYGWFGVPAEVALMAGFFSMFCGLINNAIGALLIYVRSQQKALP